MKPAGHRYYVPWKKAAPAPEGGHKYVPRKGLHLSQSRPQPQPSQPRIPNPEIFTVQELVDCIVDHVAQSCDASSDEHYIQPLLTCARISRSFYIRTTFHLFSTIHIQEIKKGADKYYLLRRLQHLHNLMLANPSLARQVHAFTLETFSVDVRGTDTKKHDQFLKSPILVRLFGMLCEGGGIRRLGLKNVNGTNTYDNFHPLVREAFEILCAVPTLEFLEFSGIASFPLHVLSLCSGNLKVLKLNLIPSLMGQTDPSVVMSWEVRNSPQKYMVHGPGASLEPPEVVDEPIFAQLEELYIVDSDCITKALLDGNPAWVSRGVDKNTNVPARRVLKNVRKISVGLSYGANIDLTWRVIKASAARLESLTITSFDHDYYSRLSPQPTLRALPSLRNISITASLRAYERVYFPSSLCTFFSSCPLDIECVSLNLKWGELDGRDDKMIFLPESGWADFENVLLGNNQHEGLTSLRRLELVLHLGYFWLEYKHNECEEAKTVRRDVKQYVDSLFTRLRERMVLVNVDVRLFADYM